MTPAEFERLADARRGRENPERFRNAAWVWMLREGCTAYEGREKHGLKSWPERPTWCFQRFGMSCTALDDGRLVCIGGEHEDHYDPDFFIYNDVTVLTPRPGEDRVDPKTCGIEMFGYPEHVLPPTDFHTATRVGDRIIVIGSLGYGDHDEDDTPVHALDTATWRIERVPARAPGPGRIHRHVASYEPASHSIVVGGGEVLAADKIRRNETTWRLHLEDGRWEQLPRTRMRWRFDVSYGGDWRDHPEDCLRFSHPSYRRLITIETNVVDYHYAQVHGALVECRDWGGSYDLCVDGWLTEEAVVALVEDLEANLRAQTGPDWVFRELPEYER